MTRIFVQLQEKQRNGTEAGLRINYPVSGLEDLAPNQYKLLSYTPTILELGIPKVDNESIRDRDRKINWAAQLALVERNLSRANGFTRSPEHSTHLTRDVNVETIVIGVNLYEVSNSIALRYARELAVERSEKKQPIYLAGQVLNPKATL